MKNKLIKTSVSLEEYIPLKILIDRDDEPVTHLSCFKETTSLLDISVGMTTGFIKRITLVSSKEYYITDGELIIDNYEIGDLKVGNKLQNSCSCFKTYLHRNGIRIVISPVKASKYIKMDKLYVGLSTSDCIVEICICQLSSNEINHTKRELDYEQAVYKS